jgi:hypothetical protein
MRRPRFKPSESGVFGVSGLLTLLYLVIGVWVAATRDYLDNLGRLRGLLSMVLAVLLWPLVLLGVDLHLGRN